MSIRFECPSCSKSIVMPDRFQGRQVRCPACDLALTVPKQSVVQPEEVELVEAEQVEQVELVPTIDQSEIEEVEVEEVQVEPLSYQPLSAPASTTQPTPTAVAPVPPKRHPRSIKGHEEEAEEDLEWDITPMVDVAFLLLIFFMLTASFSIQKVIRTKPPQSDQPSSNATQTVTEDPAEKMIIQVDEFSAYTIISPNGGTQEASSRQELVVVLKDLRILYEDQPPNVIIQAHEDSSHGAVVGCMDAAREADFSKFQLSVVEEFD